ncbi:MAG: hypothetical protein EOP06_24130 [Proteobacteria bacterium]|nr:MAG: hypothetical protein EOP06_24130 [Pseudomonadota bacterium]
MNTTCWEQFFTRDQDLAFLENYGPSELSIDPKNEQSMIDVQKRIENEEGPFYLNAMEIAAKNLNDSLTIYKPKGY